MITQFKLSLQTIEKRTGKTKREIDSSYTHVGTHVYDY